MPKHLAFNLTVTVAHVEGKGWVITQNGRVLNKAVQTEETRPSVLEALEYAAGFFTKTSKSLKDKLEVYTSLPKAHGLRPGTFFGAKEYPAPDKDEYE